MPTFPTLIRPRVQAELDAASSAEARGQFHTAFGHLERAHVLGQAATVEHVRVHWHLLRFALRHRRTADALGQAWRLAGAALFTAAGLVPAGNTGGSDVDGLRPMPIPDDLRRVIDEAHGAARPRRGPRIALTAAVALVATALAVGCGTAPADLDLALDRPTAAGVYRVTLVPPQPAPAINQLHSWQVKLATPDGAPVHDARFAVDGGMPQHGHGLPTRPRVTREIADGTYALDGMKFSMTGWWEVKLDIQGPLGADKVTFNTVVANPAVRP